MLNEHHRNLYVCCLQWRPPSDAIVVATGPSLNCSQRYRWFLTVSKNCRSWSDTTVSGTFLIWTIQILAENTLRRGALRYCYSLIHIGIVLKKWLSSRSDFLSNKGQFKGQLKVVYLFTTDRLTMIYTDTHTNAHTRTHTHCFCRTCRELGVQVFVRPSVHTNG